MNIWDEECSEGLWWRMQWRFRFQEEKCKFTNNQIMQNHSSTQYQYAGSILPVHVLTILLVQCTNVHILTISYLYNVKMYIY